MSQLKIPSKNSISGRFFCTGAEAPTLLLCFGYKNVLSNLKKMGITIKIAKQVSGNHLGVSLKTKKILKWSGSYKPLC
jgi:hypothetical protein